MLTLYIQRDSLLLQIEMLKREIAASLHDRDKAIKECSELRERFGAKEDTNKEWERSYEYDSYKQERLIYYTITQSIHQYTKKQINQLHKGHSPTTLTSPAPGDGLIMSLSPVIH